MLLAIECPPLTGLKLHFSSLSLSCSGVTKRCYSMQSALLAAGNEHIFRPAKLCTILAQVASAYNCVCSWCMTGEPNQMLTRCTWAHSNSAHEMQLDQAQGTALCYRAVIQLVLPCMCCISAFPAVPKAPELPHRSMP